MTNIIYHRGDLDGLCSAAILYEIYPDATFIGMDYHDPLPKFNPEDRYIIVDFTVGTMENMKELMQNPDSVWIDHHWSQIKEYYEGNYSFQTYLGDKENSKSACELVWEWAHGEDSYCPKTVVVLSRYDTWHHNNDEFILTFQLGARQELTSYSDPRWKLLFQESLREKALIETFTNTGKILQKGVNFGGERRVKEYAFETTFQGKKCLCMNTDAKGSLQFGPLINDYFMCITFIRTKNKSWKVSLYSNNPSINVGDIAKTFDGGGHEGAAGFSCTELPFEI